MICGYVAQLFFLMLGCIWLYLTHGAWTTYIAFTSVCGLWALVVSGVAFALLRSYEGKALDDTQGVVTTSMNRLCVTLRTLRKDLVQMRIFLLSWFIHADGTATLSSTAATFAAKELQMPAFVIMANIVEISLLSMLGAKVAVWMVKQCDVQPKVIVIVTIGMMAIAPAWGILAMTTWIEFFIAAGIYGLAQEGYFVMNRSLFASCIPRGREAEFFGFFQVTNRGTAWVGPAIVVWIATTSGNYRRAFGSIVVFFVMGGAILGCFNSELAQKERASAEALPANAEEASLKD